jgi:hypothetical protein
MRRKTTTVVPETVEHVRRRFEEWRRSPRSSGRRRIPESLWRSAVTVAVQHGTFRTARALGLNYQTLKDRVEATEKQREGAGAGRRAGFVELMTPAFASGPECIVELEDAEGAKMRIQLKGAVPVDLAVLARSFWRSEG